jgi:hypothetical protein
LREHVGRVRVSPAYCWLSTIASVHVGKGGELVEAACRRLWIANRDEGFAEMASRMREARDGQGWAERPIVAPGPHDGCRYFLAGTIFLIRYVFALSFTHCFMFSGVSGFSNPSSFVRFRE